MVSKQERKEELIRKSIHQMYQKGYNGTSVKEITFAAGIPKGSFYNYFNDKEQYAIEAVMYYYKTMINKNINLLMDVSLEPLDRIIAFFDSTMPEMEKTNYSLGCFADNLTQEMASRSDVISEAVSEFYNSIISLFTVNLQEAMVKKQLSNVTEPRILASSIYSGWQGALLRMKVDQEETVVIEFLQVLKEKLLV